MVVRSIAALLSPNLSRWTPYWSIRPSTCSRAACPSDTGCGGFPIPGPVRPRRRPARCSCCACCRRSFRCHKHRGVVQQAAVAVRDRLQLREEVGEDLDVIRIELRVLRHLLRNVRWCDIAWCASGNPISGYGRPMFSRAIMNELTRVMSAWNASTCRSNINSDVFPERLRHAGRPIRHGEIAVGRLRLYDALLDVANGVEIFAQLRAVVRAETVAQPRRSPASRRRGCCDPPRTRSSRCSAVSADPEHPFEDEPRDLFRRAAASSASSTTCEFM